MRARGLGRHEQFPGSNHMQYEIERQRWPGHRAIGGMLDGVTKLEKDILRDGDVALHKKRRR